MAAEPRLRVVLWGVSAEMDASSALLWLMAVATVAVGSVWSARDAMGELAHAGEPSVVSAAALLLACRRLCRGGVTNWLAGCHSHDNWPAEQPPLQVQEM